MVLPSAVDWCQSSATIEQPSVQPFKSRVLPSGVMITGFRLRANHARLARFIVIVAYKDIVEFGQHFERNEGRAHTFRADSGEGAAAFREYRIDKEVEAFGLY